MSQTPQPPLGGRYELRRQLSTTPAARVYLAQDLELGRPVAVKVLGPDLARNPELVERFRQAANAAAAVHDPRIVTIYDWGEDHGAVYVAMEYVEGQSLAEMLRATGHLGVAPAINIGVGIAGALDAAHRAGLVHGSLTPRDVLVTPDGSVKVTDFGTATAGLATIAGPTQAAIYQAPEQLQGRAPDARSDLYALGVVLYEAATGVPPFTGADAVAITQRKLSERVIPPSTILPGIPAGYDAIVDRLLERDPAPRYSSGTDVATALIRLGETVEVSLVSATVPVAAATAAATAAMPVTPAPTPPPPPAEEPKKKSATGWIIAAIVVLLIVVGGLVAWAVTQDEEKSKDQVAVPAVVGQTGPNAEALIANAGLHASTASEENDKFAAGLVFAQVPPAGTKLAKGSLVVLKVSTGPTPTTSTSTSTTSSTTSSTTTSTSSSTTTTTSTAPPPPPPPSS